MENSIRMENVVDLIKKDDNLPCFVTSYVPGSMLSDDIRENLRCGVYKMLGNVSDDCTAIEIVKKLWEVHSGNMAEYYA